MPTSKQLQISDLQATLSQALTHTSGSVTWHCRCLDRGALAAFAAGKRDTVFRVTRRDEAGRVVLALEGRLVEPWVSELADQAHFTLEGHPAAVTLDLDGLTFLDARAAAVLRDLRDRGAQLAGGSAFVATVMAGSSQ
jgi:hypothetical protein